MKRTSSRRTRNVFTPKMVDPGPESDHVLPDYHEFDSMLKIIPTCQRFLKPPNFPGVTPLNWKKFVMNELEIRLPFSERPVDPPNQFFNCRKSVYKMALAVVGFNRNVSEILDLLNAINASLYYLVEQHPKTGNINRLSSLLGLAVKLIETIPWAQFEKETSVKLMKKLDQILKEMKTLRRDSERLQRSADYLASTAQKVFKTRSYIDTSRIPDYGNHLRDQHENGQDARQTGSEDTKLGLTSSSDILIASGMIKLGRLDPSLKVGLLIMVLQQVREMLSAGNFRMSRVIDLLAKTKAPKKWSRIFSMQATLFERALLRKSHILLHNYSEELTHLTQFINNQSKFMYELRRPFKVLKGGLESPPDYRPLIGNFIMFQIHLQDDSRLKEYIQKDCLNQDAAKYIIENFGGRK